MAVTRGNGPSNPLDADKKDLALTEAGAALLAMPNGEFSVDGAAEDLRRKRAADDGDGSYMESKATPAEGENAKKKEEAARDRGYQALMSALAVNNAIDAMIQDLDDMLAEAEEEIEEQEEDVEDLGAEVAAIDADIKNRTADLEAGGKIHVLTLDDIKGINKQALGVDHAGNRVIYGDKKNGFYTVDENGAHRDITGGDAKKISDYIASHKTAKTGSQLDPEKVSGLNTQYISKEKAQEDARLHNEEEFFRINFAEGKIQEARDKIKTIKESDLPDAEKRRLSHQIWQDTRTTLNNERHRLGLPERHHHHGGRKHKQGHKEEDADSAQSTDSRENTTPAPAPAPSTSRQALDENKADIIQRVVTGEIAPSDVPMIAAQLGISPEHLKALDAELTADYYANKVLNETADLEEQPTFTHDDISHQVSGFFQGVEQAGFNLGSVDEFNQETMSLAMGAQAPAAPAQTPAARPVAPNMGRKR